MLHNLEHEDMSIEQAMLEHAAAIRELAAAMRGGAPAEAPAKATKATKAADKAPESTTGGKSEAGATGAPPATPAASPATVDTAPTTAGPTLEQAQAAVKKLAAHSGADQVRKLLQEFGAQRASELKPEQYADFIKKAEFNAAADAAASLRK